MNISLNNILKSYNIYNKFIRFKFISKNDLKKINSIREYDSESQVLHGPVLISKKEKKLKIKKEDVTVHKKEEKENKKESKKNMKKEENNTLKQKVEKITEVKKTKNETKKKAKKTKKQLEEEDFGLNKNYEELVKGDEFQEYKWASKEQVEKIINKEKEKKEINSFQNAPSPKDQSSRYDFILSTNLFNPTYPNNKTAFNFESCKIPSVSSILKNTMSSESEKVLKEWEKRMREELGDEGFEDYKKQVFSNGVLLHQCIKDFLDENFSQTITPQIEGHWNSLQHVIGEVEDVMATETWVTHDGLGYRGIIDCVARYQGVPCLIEWKTSKKIKRSIHHTFDNPLQTVAYLAAFNYSLSDPNFTKQLNKQEAFKDKKLIENGLLVVAYEDGSKADTHKMGREVLERFWTQWRTRLHMFWSKNLQIKKF